MAVSMTGFGMGQLSRNKWQCTIEIRTVNNRFLDISVRLPNGFQNFSQPLKTRIKQHCFRGKIDCTVNLLEEEETLQTCLNEDLARSYKNVIDTFQEITSKPVQVNLSDLLKIPDLIQTQKPDTTSEFFSSLIEDALTIALEQMQDMRIKEGNALLEDIQDRLKIKAQLLDRIEALAHDLPKLQYQRLCERLPAMNDSLEWDEERLHKEIALFADRCDITEEITRFRTHLEHMESVLQEKEVGRRADFLLQEFNREINTIASKSNNAPISQLVVEIKGQIEKIREQIQNIE